MTDEQSLLKDLADQCMDDTDRWFPEANVNNLPFMVLALCGEAGELANLVKKVERGSISLADAEKHIDEEIIDVFTYLLNIAGLRGLDLLQAYRNKRNINELRFNRNSIVFGG